MHFNVCLFSLLIFMMVLRTWMLAQIKVYFLFCMPNNTYEHMKMLLNVNKNAKIVIESELRANVRFLALFTQMIAYFLVMNSKRCIVDMAKSKTVFETLGFAFGESEVSFASQCVFTTFSLGEAVESMGGVTDSLVEQSVEIHCFLSWSFGRSAVSSATLYDRSG